MSGDVLTLGDIERAIASLPSTPPPPVYVGHPVDVAHLREHDGGQVGCAGCWGAWSRLQPVRVLP